MANQDSPKAELASLRAEVDEIDQQIILLLGVRFRCTDMIGELKQANDMDLVDPVREDQQVQRIRRLAEEAGVPASGGLYQSGCEAANTCFSMRLPVWRPNRPALSIRRSPSAGRLASREPQRGQCSSATGSKYEIFRDIKQCRIERRLGQV